jgi:hypothetical protein
MGSRQYIVGVLAVVLLIWGPIDHSWPAWLLIRLGYVVGIPLAAWFLLDWIWGHWQPDAVSEERLGLALGGATGGALLVMAFHTAVADTHIDNTMWVRTRDGMEAVGDDIVVSGPNWGNVAILIFAAGFAFWFSIAKMNAKQ